MKTTLENKFRFTTMPIPSVDYADGKPYQYIGATTSVAPIYTNGYFYKCVAQGTDPETYAWENVDVQEGGDTRIKPEITEVGIKDDSSTSSEFDFRPYIKYTRHIMYRLVDIANKYYNDEITLQEVQAIFQLGDYFDITMQAIDKGEDWGENHAEQIIQPMIVAFNTKLLANPINGHDKALFTFQMKDCLLENGIFSLNKNSNQDQWNGQARKTWANTKFKNALPTFLTDNIKSVLNNVCWYYAPDTNPHYYGNYYGTDLIYLPSDLEIGGGADVEDTRNAQYEYYTTESNRVKQRNGVDVGYATSSVRYRGANTNNSDMMIVDTSGSLTHSDGGKYEALPLSFAFNI